MYECRSRILKQIPPKPVEKRGTGPLQLPGPGQYDQPSIVGGNGYSKIRKAPAYTFGYKTPLVESKPAAVPNAPLFNVSGFTKRGKYKIPHGEIRELCGPPGSFKVPAPNQYDPQDTVRLKRPPAYSMRPAAPPIKESSTMWTPGPNMYCPPMQSRRKEPSYSFGQKFTRGKTLQMPGPGEHDPKFNSVLKTRPAFTFGYKTFLKKKDLIPAPNAYCDKGFNYSHKKPPAPSFGIRHSKYIGEQKVAIKPSKLDLVINSQNI